MESTSAVTSVKPEPPTPGFTGMSASDPHVGNGVADQVYSLDWTGNAVVRINILSAAQLQACILKGGVSARELLVFQGLPQEYEAVLKEAAGIDTSFLDAHIGRRSYRSPRRTRVGTSWSHYDYPELVCVLGDQRHGRTADDLVSEPPTYRIPATSNSVVLCHASIWLSEKAHILFLDRAPWQDPSSGVSPARYKAYTGKAQRDENGIPFTWNEMDINGHAIPRGDEIPSLGTLLHENLQDSCSDPEDQDLLGLLEDLVIDKWTDFFAVLSSDLPVRTLEIAPLFSQALGCLERNLEISRRQGARQRVVGASQEHRHGTAEWEALLARLTRQTQLLGHLAAVVEANPSQHPSAAQAMNGFGGISGAKTGSRGENKCCCSCRCHCCCKPKNKTRNDNNYNKSNYEKNHDSNNYNNANTNTHHAAQSAENQRALNRVAYLGGVLLPFSVVSGILAIESPFGPGDGQFWIFWAVTVPLTLITLGVIYADSIRKVQVWVEVAASGKGSSSSSSSSYSFPGNGNSQLGGSRLDLGVPQPSYYSNPEGRVRPPDVEYAIPAAMPGRLAQPYTISLQSAPVGSVSMHDDPEAQGGEEFSDGSRDSDEDEDADEDGRDNGDDGPEPDMIVEKRWKKDSSPQQDDSIGLDGDHWKKKKDIKWRKEELGWAGACATLFQLYRLKKGVPPPHMRHNDRRDRLRRLKTN